MRVIPCTNPLHYIIDNKLGMCEGGLMVYITYMRLIMSLRSLNSHVIILVILLICEQQEFEKTSL